MEPPSMYGDEGDYGDVYHSHEELWDSLAENLDYGSGHELFDDVAQALSEHGYGQGEGFTLEEWMESIKDIDELYQDEDGNWHIHFDWEMETEDGDYGGSRGW